MPSSVQPPASATPPPWVQVLASRDHYDSCHIQVPDQERRLAAVRVDGRYYSFFKTAKEQAQAIAIANRLAARGDASVITKTAKGYALWIWEVDAKPAPSRQTGASPQIQTPDLCTLLSSKTEYQSCHIRVPDLDRPLAAVLVNGQYYSLFKVARERQQALELAARLGKRGNPTVITSVAQGEAVWVLEPDAIPG